MVPIDELLQSLTRAYSELSQYALSEFGFLGQFFVQAILPFAFYRVAIDPLLNTNGGVTVPRQPTGSISELFDRRYASGNACRAISSAASWRQAGRLAGVVAIGFKIIIGLAALLTAYMFVAPMIEVPAERIMPAKIALTWVLIVLIAWWILDRAARRRHYANANRAINSLVENSRLRLPENEQLCLFLRSFATAQSYELRRVIKSLFMSDRLGSPEADINAVISDRAALVAIGDRHDSRRAFKLKSADAEWQALFANLAEDAKLIFCFAGPTPASVYEINVIVKNCALMRKTAFVLPPHSSASVFSRVHAEFSALDVFLPAYSADGWFYRPARESQAMQIVPYAEMLWTLARVDLNALDAAETIWIASPYFGWSGGDTTSNAGQRLPN
jgi:hypothetical protein